MIRPTSRGIAAVVVILVAVGFAWLFGARSLNAIAAPALVALAAAVVQVLVASEPTAERAPLNPGFPGETRTVTLEFEGGSTVVEVSDAVPDGLEAHGNETTIAPPATLTYDLQYERRGEHTLGPTTVRVRDVFGLFERNVTLDTEASVVVYPEVYTLSGNGELSTLLSEALTPEREEFDDLREYAPGDPLRDIDWKATAKRPDELMVAEFAGHEADGGVTIAASATETAMDETAAAAASIAVALCDVGIDVDVYAPDGHVSTTDDHADRTALLSLLARTAPGRVSDDVWMTADVAVAGTHDGVEVTIDGRTSNFRQWQTGANPLTEHATGSVVSAT